MGVGGFCPLVKPLQVVTVNKSSRLPDQTDLRIVEGMKTSLSPQFSFCPLLLALTLLLGAIIVPNSFAQVVFTGGYTQDFNQSGTLGIDKLPAPAIPASSTATFTWTNNSSNVNLYGLPGWYSSVGGSNLSRTSSGAASVSGNTIYFWGPAGTTERAMSTFSTDGFSEDTYIGLQLQNGSGTTITALGINYAVEQWRRNSNSTTLSLEYLITSTSGNQLTAEGYSTLNLTGTNASVTSTTGSPGGGLIGTTEAELLLSGISWTEGDYLWLRWVNHPSVPNAATGALAVDNLNISIIPEPGMFALFIVGMSIVFLSRKRFSSPFSK